MPYFSLPRLFLALSLAAAVARGQNAAAPDITDLQTSAYMAIMRGDQARDAEQLPEAAQAYQDALKGYQRIQQIDPAFKAKIIDYRISYCTNQIKDLQTRLAKQDNPELSSARSALKELQLRYQALESDAEALRKQTVTFRDKEQAALLKAEQAEAKAGEAAARAQKLAEAVKKLAEERAELEKNTTLTAQQRAELVEAAKSADLRAAAMEGDLAKAREEAAAAQRERQVLQKELDDRATRDSEQARMAGKTAEELEAARKRIQELEREWSALGATPAQIQEKIVMQETLRTRMEEEVARVGAENGELKARLAALAENAPNPEAMAAQRAEFEKKLAESLQRGDELAENLRVSGQELEAMRAARLQAEEQARLQASGVSNALARIEALAAESAGWSNRVQQAALELEDSRNLLKVVESRAAAGLLEQHMRATEAVRTIEANIGMVKAVRAENELLNTQLKVSENLRLELGNLYDASQESLTRMDVLQQALAQAQLEIDGLKQGVSAKENEVRSLTQGEEEFRKTIGDLRGMLTEREKEVQALRDQAAAAAAPPAPAAPEPGAPVPAPGEGAPAEAGADPSAVPPGDAQAVKEPPLPRKGEPVKKGGKAREPKPEPAPAEPGDGAP